jgi:hypothetical protein
LAKTGLATFWAIFSKTRLVALFSSDSWMMTYFGQFFED